jgi:tetratricopeptide (TPR) repeat protein
MQTAMEPQTTNDLLALLSEEPGRADLALRLGHMVLEQGQGEKADAESDNAADEKPDDCVIYNLAGLAAVQGGESKVALAMFKKAVDLAPDNPSYLANVGKCLFLRNDMAGASEYLERALACTDRSSPDNEIAALLEKIKKRDSRFREDAADITPQNLPSLLSIPPTPTPEEGCKASPQVDPADIQGLADSAIIHGPSEIAGNIERLVRHLRIAGVRSLGVNYGYNTWANFKCDLNLDITNKPPQQAAELAGTLFGEALKSYDIFHYHYARGFLPKLDDLDHLKQKGKKIIFSFYGSDQRSPEVFYYNQAKFLGYNPPKPYYFTIPLYSNHRLINRYADMIYAATGVPRGYFNQGVADTVQWDPEEKQKHLDLELMYKDKDKLYILHAPTNANLKGSGILERMLAECLEEGMPIELIRFKRDTLAEVKKMYAYADCAIDQVGAGTFGLFGIEMMCWEIPVLVYQTDLFRRIRNNPPVIGITKASLKEKLLTLLQWKRSGRLREVGRDCREYATAHCDISKVGIPKYASDYHALVRNKKIEQYINKSWFEEELKLQSGIKSEFYRYMIEHDIFRKLGVEIPEYDRRLYH